jgi:hypothetical protein
LFEPENKELRDRLRLGAEALLRWQRADGSWPVAFDHVSKKPLFTELQDLRPTFYGLLVAHRLLKDPKFLLAAKKGADRLIREGLDKGAFLGVCGDTRYAPDFATAQAAGACLELYEQTGELKYKDAAIRTARIYTTSVYTHPMATTSLKKVKGVDMRDWEISQNGLGFEHGGVMGSANTLGPIQLCSHAGLFIRMYGLTGERVFADMARAAAIGRDAFVNKPTGVASYYWIGMDHGAGAYPHHAWWQIGWITDYLVAEAELRSKGTISFPKGFMTPKVGPHRSVGFAPGKVNGQAAELISSEGLLDCDDPQVEYLAARSMDGKRTWLIFLNDVGRPVTAKLKLKDAGNYQGGIPATISLGAYGLQVLALNNK